MSTCQERRLLQEIVILDKRDISERMLHALQELDTIVSLLQSQIKDLNGGNVSRDPLRRLIDSS